MEKELEEYIKQFDYEQLKVILSKSQLDLTDVVIKVFKDAYLLGYKNATQLNPLATFWEESEEDNIWDDIYSKQLAEEKLTEIKQE